MLVRGGWWLLILAKGRHIVPHPPLHPPQPIPTKDPPRIKRIPPHPRQVTDFPSDSTIFFIVWDWFLTSLNVPSISPPRIPPPPPPPPPPRLIHHPRLRERHNPPPPLVLQPQILEHGNHICDFGGGERGGGGVPRDERVEEGEGDGAARFREENAGEEEVEGVVGESFLEETEAGGGEWGEGDAGGGEARGARGRGEVG